MGLLVSKWITRMAMPLGASLLLVVLGLCLVRRRALAGFACIGAGAGWLWLCSLPVISDRLQATLEAAHLPVPVSEAPRVDAIVVLGGGVEPALAPRSESELGEAADRVLHAARLYHAGRAPLVIASGGRPPTRAGGASESALMATLLEEWGVPPARIVLEAGSRSTRENCLGLRELLQERAIDDVLLVTSALHMRRALAACNAVQIRAHAAPTDYRVVDGDSSVLDWLPDASALEGTTRALRELLGYEVYRMRGWIDPARAGGGKPSAR